MPNIYLSPSLQEYNPYVGGGNEEYYMNLLADALVPYLEEEGITFTRNNPANKLTDVINESNAGQYDLHLALHSNAAGPDRAGAVQGVEVYYYPGSEKGEKFADLIVDEFKKIYPNPEKIKKVPTTTLAEIRRVGAPSVLIEVAYHDNVDDANWIRNNIGNIANSLNESLKKYFFGGQMNSSSMHSNQMTPNPSMRTGTVMTQSGSLNLRQDPNTGAKIIGQIPKGAKLMILDEINDWYKVDYDGKRGYVNSFYVKK